MSEGKWLPAKFDDIREGDTVRVTAKSGPQTTITEGKVTRCEELGVGETYWTVEDWENFYTHEFEPHEDADSTLEKLVVPFVWPEHLGAVVKAPWQGESGVAHFVRVRKEGSGDSWVHSETGNFYAAWEIELLGKDFVVVGNPEH